jgi:hypothetical protein
MHYWSKIVNFDFGFIFCRGQKAPENHAFADGMVAKPDRKQGG